MEGALVFVCNKSASVCVCGGTQIVSSSWWGVGMPQLWRCVVMGLHVLTGGRCFCARSGTLKWLRLSVCTTIGVKGAGGKGCIGPSGVGVCSWRAVQSLTRPLLRSPSAPSPVFTLTFAPSHRRDPVLVCDGCGDCEPPVGGRVVPLALPQPRATLPVRGH